MLSSGHRGSLLVLGLLVADSLGVKQQNHPNRNLVQEPIFSYEPKTQVTDIAAIDLDQRDIEDILGSISESDADVEAAFDSAIEVYQDGAHSGSYAQLSLSSPLASALPEGTEVLGLAQSGAQVLGHVADDANEGDEELVVLYATSDVQSKHVGCQVGASPNPIVEGCFVPDGDITVTSDDGSTETIGYSYDVLADNRNDRTISGFSTDAEERMYTCDNCPYADYEVYYNYYGEFDYGDLFILSAFEQTATAFANGNADFSLINSTDSSDEGFAEVIQKGTVYLNIWMYVIREMESALDDCNNGCNNGNDDECNNNEDNVNAWDKAVALYTGSQQESDPESGYLLYSIANEWCSIFNTCSKDESGAENANVNAEIFDNFIHGQRHLAQGNCDEARAIKERIVELMTVPLVQGTLALAYLKDNTVTPKDDDIDTSAEELEGAVIAASILPQVYACSERDANIIHEHMQVGGEGTIFTQVKAALERNYRCMGIACDEVGGILNTEIVTSTVYLQFAEPCECYYNVNGTNSDGNNVFEDERCFPPDIPFEDPTEIDGEDETPTEPEEEEEEEEAEEEEEEEEEEQEEEPEEEEEEEPEEEEEEEEEETEAPTSSGPGGSIGSDSIKLFSWVIFQAFGVVVLLPQMLMAR